MLHHTPSKRLHEEDISESVDPDSIKRPRVLHELISPRSPLSDFPTTTTAIEVFPDAIELPEEDIHTQRRKHSLDTISEKDDSEDELLEDAAGQSPRRHSRQRRRISEDLVADDDDDDEALNKAHKIMLPTEYIRKIPEVVLEPHKPPHHLPSSNGGGGGGITTSLTTTAANLQQQQQPSRGPVIEEIPYNPLALIPYSPPPLIFFPGLASSPQNAQQSRDTMEESGGDGDAMEVLPILTPLDAGYMLGPMNTQCDNDEEDDDAMEE